MIVASRDLPSGHVIEPGDLDYRSPGTGIPPAGRDKVVGKKLTQSILEGTPLREEDLQLG